MPLTPDQSQKIFQTPEEKKNPQSRERIGHWGSRWAIVALT